MTVRENQATEIPSDEYERRPGIRQRPPKLMGLTQELSSLAHLTFHVLSINTSFCAISEHSV